MSGEEDKCANVSSAPSYGAQLSTGKIQGPMNDAEEAAPRKIFINGQPVENVIDFKIESDMFRVSRVKLEMAAKDVELKDGDIYITLNEDRRKLTPQQLKKMIADNLDNFKAIEVGDKLNEINELLDNEVTKK